MVETRSSEGFDPSRVSPGAAFATRLPTLQQSSDKSQGQATSVFGKACCVLFARLQPLRPVDLQAAATHLTTQQGGIPDGVGDALTLHSRNTTYKKRGNRDHRSCEHTMAANRADRSFCYDLPPTVSLQE